MKRARKTRKTRKTRKPKSKAVAVVPQYVTREMLADLRDEIEDVVEVARIACEQASKQVDKANKWPEEMLFARRKLLDAYDDLNHRLEEFKLDLKRIQAVLGLDINRHTVFQPVTWSYFHVWISRINERLEKLEKRALFIRKDEKA